MGVVDPMSAVVTHEGKILEKPTSADEAREFMRGFGRSPCSTVGSLMLTHIPTRRQVSGISIATLHFDSIPESVIEQLIEEGDVRPPVWFVHCA